MILSEKVLMIEPRGFSFNKKTSADNFFQSTANIKFPAETALKEFQDLKYKLMRAGITVIVVSPEDQLATPDGVFPNNWFSTSPYGHFILYPMMASNRRLERRKDIIDKFRRDYKELIDLSSLEEKDLFLEGTGSLVIDHENKTAYASLSKRTNIDALKEWSTRVGYTLVTFTSYDKNGEIIYHTNVVLSLGDGFAIVCLEAIRDEKEREQLREKLSERNELITLTLAQLHAFCGNCLELRNAKGEKFLVMSAQAYNAFTEKQKNTLIRHTSIIYSGLTTIETIGGGSARCMMAELF
jgi:hypothetical protein